MTKLGAVHSEIIEIPLAKIFTFERHPLQRDEVRRAPKAHKLHVFEDVHKYVSAVEYQGRTILLDGHTRRYIWSNPHLYPNVGILPVKLVLTLYHASTWSEVLELYSRFDSQHAVETSTDILTGALGYRDLQLRSKYMQRLGYLQAVNATYVALATTRGGLTDLARKLDRDKNKSRHELIAFKVGVLSRELKLLDDLDLPYKTRTWEAAAMLFTLAVQGNPARDMWNAYVTGMRQEELNALNVVKAIEKKFQQMGIGGSKTREQFRDAMAFCVKAVDLFVKYDLQMISRTAYHYAREERIVQLAEDWRAKNADRIAALERADELEVGAAVALAAAE